jgi:hypothetical protein
MSSFEIKMATANISVAHLKSSKTVRDSYLDLSILIKVFASREINANLPTEVAG